MLEYTGIRWQYYTAPLSYVQKHWTKGKMFSWKSEVQGAKQVKEKEVPDGVFYFLTHLI